MTAMDGRLAHWLNEPVTSLTGVGARLAELFARLQIHTLWDLCCHFPIRYEDRTHITPIRQLRHGETAVVQGTVVDTTIRYGKRRALIVTIEDDTAALAVWLFHFFGNQKSRLTPGTRLRSFGEARWLDGRFAMVHPETQILKGDADPPLATALTPVYSTTEGLGQATVRRAIHQTLARLQTSTATLVQLDLLPELMRQELGLVGFVDALLAIHQPQPGETRVWQEGQHPAQHRFAFEELLAHHLCMRERRRQQFQILAPAFTGPRPLVEKFIAGLHFQLTGAQQRVIEEVFADCARATPMQRLVQGDVGSGKTVVAALALLRAVEHGFQGALMAPTELLAEQHGRSLALWFGPLGVNVVYLSGSLSKAAREAALGQIVAGTAQVIVGTHAVFQDDVRFHSLGLIVIDEQHRFGVAQRLALREKGRTQQHLPHQLVMTATPIPRTLAMITYGDLDISIIDELPAGRQPVTTVAVPEQRRGDVLARIRSAVASGQQAYWVCPLIDESETLQCQAAVATAAELAAALSGMVVGLVHGKLSTAEKDRVMGQFRAGEVQVLVATTVIEVGVDVPNATLMVIENAERLGLAQLHQLRGRVGRGAAASACVLLYKAPLSELGRARLQLLRETNDGFEVARRDLALRGPGQLLGTKQSGLLAFRVADLARHHDFAPKVAECAEQLQQYYPSHVSPLIERWLGASRHLGDV